MKFVKFDNVIKLLKEYSDMKDALVYLPHRKPTHGPCCTCQDCGHYYDDCVCLHNEIIMELSKVTEEI
ncbi:unnamed protein product [marine sediment metagenome]|uniref:Uncharacterized protein n=1 Tax=marine sediment metagenome TaxID=412755 RepID=X0V8E7_9ZZZZ